MTKYFENWVKRMNASFWNCCDKFQCVQYFNGVNKIVTVLNAKTGKVGIAKCHSDDVYNTEIGRAIAYARCCGKPVPDMNYEPAIKQEHLKTTITVNEQKLKRLLDKYDILLNCRTCACKNFCDSRDISESCIETLTNWLQD